MTSKTVLEQMREMQSFANAAGSPVLMESSDYKKVADEIERLQLALRLAFDRLDPFYDAEVIEQLKPLVSP